MSDLSPDKTWRLAALGYLLFFLGVLFGVTAVVGAILSHTLFRKTTQTFARSHLTLQLIAFWVIVGLISGVVLFKDTPVAAWLGTAALAVWLSTVCFGAILLVKQRAINFLQH